MTDKKNFQFSMLFLMVLFMMASIYGCKNVASDEEFKKEDLRTEYQWVLLTSGIGYFGKIEKISPQLIEMTDTFFVISQQNPETKQVENRLVKKSNEPHKPDRMYINMRQVVMIEPVAPDSKIAQAIKTVKSQTGNAN